MTFGVQCHIQRRLFAVSDAEEAQHVPVKSVPWLNNNHCGWVSSSLVHPVRLPQFNYPSNSIQFYSVESNWIPPESVPMIRCSLATRRRWAKATFPSCVTSHRINVIGVPLLTQQQRNPTTAPDTSCVFSLSLSPFIDDLYEFSLFFISFFAPCYYSPWSASRLLHSFGSINFKWHCFPPALCASLSNWIKWFQSGSNQLHRGFACEQMPEIKWPMEGNSVHFLLFSKMVVMMRKVALADNWFIGSVSLSLNTAWNRAS